MLQPGILGHLQAYNHKRHCYCSTTEAKVSAYHYPVSVKSKLP